MLMVRDVLDGKLRDAYRREIGRVDGIVLELVPGNPRPVAWHRVHPALARLGQALRRRFGPRQVEPARIPWSAVTAAVDGLKVSVDADQTPAMAWELWLREHVVRRIPFSGSGR